MLSNRFTNNSSLVRTMLCVSFCHLSKLMNWLNWFTWYISCLDWRSKTVLVLSLLVMHRVTVFVLIRVIVVYMLRIISFILVLIVMGYVINWKIMSMWIRMIVNRKWGTVIRIMWWMVVRDDVRDLSWLVYYLLINYLNFTCNIFLVYSIELARC
jgi:hypothetical protein